MASSKAECRNHETRSSSSPCLSHPSIIQIEKELTRFKSFEATSPQSAETICDCLLEMGGLYKAVNDLFCLPLTKHAISRHQHDKRISVLMDGSVAVLDICGNTKDLILQTKESLSDIQSALRRKKSDLSAERSIAQFISLRKKTKKDAKSLMASLKQVDNQLEGSSLLGLNHHLLAVMQVVMQVNAMTISVFQSLLMFFSGTNARSQHTKWSVVSKLMRKGTIACKDQHQCVNEFESVDVMLSCNLSQSNANEGECIKDLQRRLEKLESCVEGIESGLKCMFRCLIDTRASMLNIISN